MKKYLLPILTLFVCLIVTTAHATMEGGGGNYSKDKACNLPDGTYGYNIQISNYPGYNTFVKNFVKDQGVLYYAVSATPINDMGGSENFLWSWDCKNKKPKQLSQELVQYYGHQKMLPYQSNISKTPEGIELPQIYLSISDQLPQLAAYGDLTAHINENTIEIDYMSKTHIVVRYRMTYETCVRFDFQVDAYSRVSEQGCAYYRDIKHYRHVVLDRATMAQSTLGFDPNEENYSDGVKLVSGYKPFAMSLREKYGSIICDATGVSRDTSLGSHIGRQYKFSEYATIPANSKCRYDILSPYVVDLTPFGKSVRVSVKYGDGISGYTGFMKTIKMDLANRKIIK